MPARCGFVLLALLCACAEPPVADTVQVRVVGTAGRPLSAAAIHYSPADNVGAARLSSEGVLTIERRDRARALTVTIPELCPIAISAGPQREPARARAVIDLGRERAPVGFDAELAIKVAHGCAERGLGKITWRQIEGAAISALEITRDGFELRARMPSFESLHPEPPPPGIVPMSPRTQGRVVLEALWQGPGSPDIRRTIAIRATSRATGMSSVAVSQQIMLSGSDWRVLKAPQGGHAKVHAIGSLFSFTPDAPGRWTLGHGADDTLVLQALWHDKTPYDCGRAECHASIAETTLSSPMSAALQRHLEAPEPAAVGCMLECHVLGEPGLHDGGFLDVSGQLGFSWLDGTQWRDLPQPLRRLGGVRCTACHGPGVLPEPEGRELVLSSDVCATCHDAPPRYVHVEQWRASRMSRSDLAPGTRSDACAGCHTTAGFLERVAGPRPKAHALDADSAPIGIACAACHAPHSSHRGARLVRSVPASALEEGAAPSDPRSALCLSCHAPAPDSPATPAPGGALWEGIARLSATNGTGWDVLRAAGAHAQVSGGCIGCHGAQEGGGVDHSFRVNTASCTPCHTAESNTQLVRATKELEQEARALVEALAPSCAPRNSAEPAHAVAEPPACKTAQQTRAMHALAILLEDRAALAHNPELARMLLDQARRP